MILWISGHKRHTKKESRASNNFHAFSLSLLYTNRNINLKLNYMLFNHILIALLLAAGCSSSKNQSGENKKPDEATQTTTASATTGTTSEATETISHDSMTTAKVNAQTNDNNYRLIVSFISIGEGTDIKAHEKFDAFMSSWQTENN